MLWRAFALTHFEYFFRTAESRASLVIVQASATSSRRDMYAANNCCSSESPRASMNASKLKQGFQFGVHWEKQLRGWRRLRLPSSDFAAALGTLEVEGVCRRVPEQALEVGSQDRP